MGILKNSSILSIEVSLGFGESEKSDTNRHKCQSTHMNMHCIAIDCHIHSSERYTSVSQYTYSSDLLNTVGSLYWKLR